ncbi:MAG: hypothetical protein N2442_04890 [Spirochaetes bacterium]|nr:hypothetical protein [Spirochaetota bacterium]
MFRDSENWIQIQKAPEAQNRYSHWFLGLTSNGRGPALSLNVSTRGLEALLGEVELTSPLLPALQFRGTLSLYGPAELLLQIHSVRIFDNWNNGWTEGEAEGFGTILFRREYLRWWGTLRDRLGIGKVRSGEVRYFDHYYRGEEGTRRVQARIQRLLTNITQGMEKPSIERIDCDMEETPGLYLSLVSLTRINQQLETKDLLFLPSEN